MLRQVHRADSSQVWRILIGFSFAFCCLSSKSHTVELCTVASMARPVKCRERLLFGMTKNMSYQVRGLAVRTWGRYGNNWYQLTRALAYSAFLELRRIYLKPPFLYFNHSFIVKNGIEVVLGRPIEWTGVILGFFCFEPFDTSCIRCNLREGTDILRDHVLACLPRVLVHNSSLVMHLRSGDIFQGSGNPFYGQPPCSFYLRAMEMDGDHSNSQIVSENDLNPCVHFLVRHGAVFRPASLPMDLGRMVFCHRFVLARSLLSKCVMYLSPWPKTHYTFQAKHREWGKHVNCEPTDDYVQKVLGSAWRNTRNQRLLLLRASCSCSVV
jgi:hypothetical protein